ncbi:MAG: protein kinase [Gemmatimonadota bacterium]|nr:protein kinase [Gemmatimonadota bacterium]
MSPIPERLQAALAERYTIERELGAGGMATVYLAHDRKHDRQVAIKVLRPELAAVIGAERFLSEIKTTANLQHPHILPLFDSGVADTFLFYVMPFVEGESLRDRLAREKQLPIGDAVRIATEVAGALDYAHRHNVIHRDIKPENILLHDGRALVADFGIALAASKAGGSRMTETGMSLGTPTYMSPEQAMGEREITARSDVYALGCVTYEMLVGDPPFLGGTAQAIVAKVMTEKPARPSRARDTVPEAVEEAVLTALEKLPADRWGSAREFAEALEGGAAGRTRSGTRRATSAVPAASRLARAAPWVLAMLGGAAALFAWTRRPAADPPVVRFTIPAVANDRVSSLGYNPVTVSPDGQTLVYVGAGPGARLQLVARRLDEVTTRPLPGTEDGTHPFFSPDGGWVGFIRSNQVFKIALDGSVPQLVAPAPGTFNGASWALDGRIIVSGNRALYAIPENGGAATLLPGPERIPGEQYRTAPLLLADGRHLVYSSWGAASTVDVHMAILTLATGETKRLELQGIHALGMVDGALVYATVSGLLMAVRVDVGAGKVLGTPVQLVDNVTSNSSTGLARAAVSPAGTLVYQGGAVLSRVVIAGPEGITRLGLEDSRDYTFPRLSPDGRRLAIGIGAAGSRDVWIYALGARTLTRLTSGTLNERPEWSPDGTRVLYRADLSGRAAIWWRPVDLSAEATPVIAGPDLDVFEAQLAPDARRVVFQLDTSGADVYYRGLTGDTTMHPVANSPAAIENMPRISPDGRWIAFVTNESGRDEVVVQPFPGPGGRVQVSADGGTEPLWSRDGTRLFYRGSGHLMAAKVATGAGFAIAARDSVLVDRFLYAANPHPNWDVLPDGKHFLFLQPTDAGEMTVTANWLPVLRARLAAAGSR